MTQPLKSSIITQADLRREVKLPLYDGTGRDAATVLGISRTKAYALANSGEIPTIRLGRRWFVTTATINRLLDGEDRPPTPVVSAAPRNPLAVLCPRCGAVPGQECRMPSGLRASTHYRRRVALNPTQVIAS